jgi:hypothetical protein
VQLHSLDARHQTSTSTMKRALPELAALTLLRRSCHRNFDKPDRNFSAIRPLVASDLIRRHDHRGGLLVTRPSAW